MFATPILATIGMITSLEMMAMPLVIERGGDHSLQAEVLQAADPAIVTIATLADGNYQVCSAPDLMNWQNGAGVCFVFNKMGDRVEGYYGYPHSDQFICLRGNIENNLITGEAFTLSWAGNVWENIPDTPFVWDDEGHLTLNQGHILPNSDHINEHTDWILFNHAVLDTNQFYPYSLPRMVDPAQLCNWDEL